MDRRSLVASIVALGATRGRFFMVDAQQTCTLQRGSNNDGCDFSGQRLDGTLFRDGSARGALFVGTSLGGSILRDDDFTGANFTDANLTGANLRGSNLTGATFVGADLSGANLRGAAGFNDAGAKLCNTYMPDGSISNRDC